MGVCEKSACQSVCPHLVRKLVRKLVRAWCAHLVRRGSVKNLCARIGLYPLCDELVREGGLYPHLPIPKPVFKPIYALCAPLSCTSFLSTCAQTCARRWPAQVFFQLVRGHRRQRCAHTPVDTARHCTSFFFTNSHMGDSENSLAKPGYR